jgi:hypothetical protein
MRLHHSQGINRAQAKIRNRAAMRRINLNALFAAFLPPAIGTAVIFGGIFSPRDGYLNYWSKLSAHLKFFSVVAAFIAMLVVGSRKLEKKEA